MPWTQEAYAMGAAFLAGAINAIAGGGTLISFPALLVLGLTGQQANVTSTLALWPGSVGGFLGHREDLRGIGAMARRLVAPSVAGALVGAGLMLATPAKVFDNLVPWLLLVATLLTAFQERLGRWTTGMGQDQRWWAAAIAFQFLVGLYGGFFGAGIGILMLGALSLLGLRDIHQMNGLKNLLALSINLVAILCFLAYEAVSRRGYVVWHLAGLMAVSAMAGGYLGAHLAHRAGRKAVRFAVILAGCVLTAIYMIRRFN